MPRFPKPWYRSSRKRWYVQIGGTQYNLGPNRKEAFRRYHALMQRPEKPQVVADGTVIAVIDTFLDWCQKNRAEGTYEWYLYRLQHFADFIPVDLRTADLRPYHLQSWIDTFPNLSSGGKRNYCRAVQRVMNWSEEQGYVDRSPLAHFVKPPAGKRETVISQEQFDEILSVVPDRGFRDLLITAIETGARPQELLAVESRHDDVKYRRWVFAPGETKTKKYPRVIYLTDEPMAITRRLMMKHPSGPLFRNSNGRPWTTEAVNNAFIRIQIRMGKRVMKDRQIQVDKDEIEALVQDLRPNRTVKGKQVPKTLARLREEAKRKLTNRMATKLAPKYCLCNLRHSWATHALEKRVDPLTVAILMGHADPSMLAKTYQHLSKNPQYLMEEMRRATA